MYQARETKTGRLVRAEDASAYGSYQCPLCRAPVSARRGVERAAHFAHRPGSGSRECENYFPSADYYLHGGWNAAGSVATPKEDERLAPLSLSIVVEPTRLHTAKSGGRWGLNLMVPKSPDAQGKIVVDCGINFNPTISLLKLSQGAQTYPADPDAQYFRASWVSHEVSAAYRAAVTEPIAGLRPESVTAFAVVSQKQKPRVASLSWGADYYFVWHEKLAMTAPDAVVLKALDDDYKKWHCALVSLPCEEDEATSDWLRIVCDLNVVTEKRKWGIFYPIAHSMDISGKIRFPPSKSFLIGFSGSDQSSAQPTFSSTLNGVTQSIDLNDDHAQFLEVASKDFSNDAVLTFEWDNYRLSTCEISPLPLDHEGSEVVISFAESAGGAAKKIPLHFASCKLALAKVRDGKWFITELRLPSALEWQFAHKPANDVHWQTRTFPASSSAISKVIALASEDLDFIRKRLSDRDVDVSLDFGAFGTYRDQARVVSVAQPGSRPLGRQTRTAILWYCNATAAYFTPSRQVVGAASDQELIAHFSSLSAPMHLIAHKRSIERQLSRIAR